MASVVVSGYCAVYANGTNYTVTLPLTNANPIAVPVQTQTISTGVNTISVPTGVVNGVWIIPPSGSSLQKTYKGVSGDTGIGGANGNPASWVFLPVTGSSFVILAGDGSETLTLVWD